MNTLKKIGAVSLTMIVFLFISNTLMAQRGDSTRALSHGHRDLRMRAEQGTMGIPNLTDDQKVKIKAQRITFGKEALPLKNQLAEKERT